MCLDVYKNSIKIKTHRFHHIGTELGFAASISIMSEVSSVIKAYNRRIVSYGLSDDANLINR